MKKLTIFILIILCINTAWAQKKKLEADKKTSFVKYGMKHPMHDWDAKSTDSKAVIVYNADTKKVEAVAVVTPIKSFDSGNSNRDSHTIEVLEALKFPNVSFSASSVVDNGDQIIAKGNLNFHGVVKPIEIKATKTSINNIIKIDGGFSINMKDYGVDPPGLMGIKAQETIVLSFSNSFKII